MPEDLDKIADAIMDNVSEIADDTTRFTQGESAELYEEVANACSTAARAIRQEMNS